ncbi:MAG: ABC transporter ATP-binding protein [Cyanobacteria bacterium SZAS-4]|nr:ABC transporter ATP-binding protein [Cyanobacteria bacterium SZAS-4]
MTSAVIPASNKSTSLVIEVKNLTKNYGDFEAVKGISFSIERGEIFGLIGPDGAGKTSTFHVLGGVMDATAGDINVLGQTPRLARKKIGYLTQQFSLHLDLSIWENLVYSAGVREVSDHQFNERSKKYLQLMDLYKFRTRLAGQLSGGMKQKLALCCALVSAPEILLLDEPTTGVDPVSRREFWDVLAEVAAEGVTTAVATPYLDEAERCNRVALINDGLIKQMGTPRDLIVNLGMHRLEVHSKELAKLESALASDSNKSNVVADVQEFGDRLDILTPDVDKGKEFVTNLARQEGDNHAEINVSEPSLENVFVSTLRSTPQGQARDATYKFRDRPQSISEQGKVAIGADKIGIHFGSFQAVKSVSLKVGYGEIFGLLGANGAGKTTTIKMLCGLLTPSQGSMVLAGAKSDLRSSALRKRIGYMSQKFTLYDDLSVKENLDFYCGVYEVPENERREKIDWALSSCGLKGQEKLLTKSLPGGWKQRLSFAASVMHQPEILFLDEPTSGVDPLARRQLWRYIRQFARNGTAVLVTTHFLEEAEHCQNLAFMVAGEIVAKGTPTQIKQEQPGKLVEIVVDNSQEAARVIRENVAAWKVAIFADALHVALDEPEKELPVILQKLRNSNVNVIRHRDISFSLEDAFIGIVQRASENSR